MTFDEFRDGDRTYRALAKKSADAAQRSYDAPMGTKRAVNARIAWSRAAEARDFHEKYLRRMYEARFPQKATA